MDARFDVRKDPRFKKLPAPARKVVLDDRFNGLLKDPGVVGAVKDPKTGRKRRRNDHEDASLLRKLYTKAPTPENLTEPVEGLTPSEDGVLCRQQSLGVTSEHTRTDRTRSPSSRPTDDTGDDDDSLSDGSGFSWSEQSDSSDDVSSVESSEEDDDEEVTGVCEGTEGLSAKESTINGKKERKRESCVWDTLEQEDNPDLGEASQRLAILGCDWDVVNAQDLFQMLNSFLAGRSGKIKRVAIYLSDFGKERLEHEAVHGPAWSLPESRTDSAKEGQRSQKSEGDEEDEAVREALRRYQKERARYYYAIVECDRVETAAFLYGELEGVDSEVALDGFDLRFVPNSTEAFTDKFPRPPRSVATEVSAQRYVPPESFVSALRHTKVRCTWDETPAVRTKRLRKRFNADEMALLDLKDYLASSESEPEPITAQVEREGVECHDEEDVTCIDAIELPPGQVRIRNDEAEEAAKKKAATLDSVSAYRKLLLGEDGDRPSKMGVQEAVAGDVEVTFDPAVEQRLGGVSSSLNGHGDGDPDALGPQDSITPWEKYLQKKKLNKKERKAELQRAHREKEMLREAEKAQKAGATVAMRHKAAFPLIAPKEDPALFLQTQGDDNAHSDGTKSDGTATEEEDLKTRFSETVGDTTAKAAKPWKLDRERRKKRREMPGYDRMSGKEKNNDVQVDFKHDARFGGLYTDPDLALDPTHPGFKMTKTYKGLLSEKIERRRERRHPNSRH